MKPGQTDGGGRFPSGRPPPGRCGPPCCGSGSEGPSRRGQAMEGAPVFVQLDAADPMRRRSSAGMEGGGRGVLPAPKMNAPACSTKVSAFRAVHRLRTPPRIVGLFGPSVLAGVSFVAPYWIPCKCIPASAAHTLLAPDLAPDVFPHRLFVPCCRMHYPLGQSARFPLRQPAKSYHRPAFSFQNIRGRLYFCGRLTSIGPVTPLPPWLYPLPSARCPPYLPRIPPRLICHRQPKQGVDAPIAWRLIFGGMPGSFLCIVRCEAGAMSP